VFRGAGIGIDDVAHFDLYSCFGASLNFARDALGLAPGDTRALTVTGGLPYHGGPASNYMGHSIATMADVLRADPGAYGLVSGVGMAMTKHAYGLYSTEPGPVGPPNQAAVQAELDAHPVPEIRAGHAGPATVAAYSVVHGRSGEPERAVAVCDLPDGARAYATITDADLVRSAEEVELVGATLVLEPVTVPLPTGGDGTQNFARLP